MKDRDVTAMLMGLTVAWHTYGFATGFFGRAWRDAPVPVIPISYALNAALAVFAPLARGGKRGDCTDFERDGDLGLCFALSDPVLPPLCCLVGWGVVILKGIYYGLLEGHLPPSLPCLLEGFLAKLRAYGGHGAFV